MAKSITETFESELRQLIDKARESGVRIDVAPDTNNYKFANIGFSKMGNPYRVVRIYSDWALDK